MSGRDSVAIDAIRVPTLPLPEVPDASLARSPLTLVAVALAAAACSSSTAPGWTYAPPTPAPLGRRRPRAPRAARPAAPGGGRAAASGAASGGPTAVPGGSGGAGGTSSSRRSTSQFTTPEVTAPADAPFTIHFDNKDAGTPHNVEIKDASGAEVFKGEIVTGVTVRDDYQVPALAGRHVPVRVQRPPEHDGHAQGRRLTLATAAEDAPMTARVDEVCYRDAYARDARGARPRGRGGATARRSSSSTRRCSTRAAAASRRTAASILRDRRRPRAGSVRAARRSAARSSTSSSRPTTASCRDAGDRVAVDLDWARRHALMRTHTALHALCGVVWRDYGALVTGGNMEPGAGRMDFEFERMSGDLVGAIEATRQRRSCAAARDVRVERPAARRGVRDPRPDPDEGQPAAARGSRRSARSRSSASTSRPTAAPTSPTPARSAASGSPATSRRAGSTSASGSSSSSPTDARACAGRDRPLGRTLNKSPGSRFILREPAPTRGRPPGADGWSEASSSERCGATKRRSTR